ncbi:MAG: 16S rRNA (cytidine(1402)-2'-O)-methyltransferase [Deltaproteobacteria bacterium]|nr:MAG: 16S rRNA (cytidine(1402)-2'-O)-methyltransferase [Deltaproteobacteria bacterium]
MDLRQTLSEQSGMEVYIVATPIGNIEDITLRALRILKEVDLVAAEDTRNTQKLFSMLDINTKLTSLHEHNEKEKSAYLVELVLSGKKIAVVSDAGTPLVSDPGYRFIEEGLKKGIRFVPVPGVSAVTALASVSGFFAGKFAFFGFFPSKESLRNKVLDELENSDYPIMFFESPKRIVKTLGEIIEKKGDRKGVLGRELTKIYEEVIRGNLSEIIEILLEKEKIKGEICFFVEGGIKKSQEIDLEKIIMDKLSSSKKKSREIAGEIAGEYNLKKNEIYNLILKVSGKK